MQYNGRVIIKFMTQVQIQVKSSTQVRIFLIIMFG